MGLGGPHKPQPQRSCHRPERIRYGLAVAEHWGQHLESLLLSWRAFLGQVCPWSRPCHGRKVPPRLPRPGFDFEQSGREIQRQCPATKSVAEQDTQPPRLPSFLVHSSSRKAHGLNRASRAHLHLQRDQGTSGATPESVIDFCRIPTLSKQRHCCLKLRARSKRVSQYCKSQRVTRDGLGG